MLTQTIKVPVFAPVFAGAPVNFNHWKIDKFRELRIGGGVTVNGSYGVMPVVGDSLVVFRIFDGDFVVFKRTARPRADKIHVFQTPDGLTAKFVDNNGDGTVTLHNRNGWRQTWACDEVQLVGEVVRVERDF